MEYKTKQVGWVVVGVTVGIAVIIATTSFILLGTDQEFTSMAIFMIGLFAVLPLLFGTLETTVNAKEIKIKFGIGLIKKTIPKSSVKGMKVVKNKFVYGWGIRFTPHGWLWNIAGYDAVEFDIKDSKHKFRLGCKDPKEMIKEIKKRK
ncbi:MAG: hypothetical protein ACI857_000492 [Arenicella sp.]|jgi:hypothetical protein